MTTRHENHDSNTLPDPQRKLEDLLSQSANRFCADCSSPDPKWVSLSIGVFICIKCSGVHRSLGVHISKVLSVKLDEWTDELVNSFIYMGGNAAANMRYEALLPNNLKKPRPDSSIEERSDFIRRKYVLQQFLDSNVQIGSSPSASLCSSWQNNVSSSNSVSSPDKKCYDKQHTNNRLHGLGHAFRNSWRRKESDHKAAKKLSMQVYDKDTFSSDDRMGQAEIDIQPLVSAAKAYENSTITGSMQLGKWLATEDNTLVKDSVISLIDGQVKQEMTLRLQNVERGELQIELECVPLSQ